MPTELALVFGFIAVVALVFSLASSTHGAPNCEGCEQLRRHEK